VANVIDMIEDEDEIDVVPRTTWLAKHPWTLGDLSPRSH